MCCYDHRVVVLKEEDRHFINSEEHNNCVICLSEAKGPMTQAEIASYLDLSKMRICQIEHKALEKLKKKLNPIFN